MVRNTLGGSANSRRAELSVLLFFFVFCMMSSGALYAVFAIEISAGPAAVNDAPVDVVAELEAILKKNKKCLKCHSRDKFKTLENGEQMSLQVHREDYIGSAHGEFSCVGCHEAIGNRRHPSKKTNITITSQRDYAVELNQGCRNCHANNYTEYEHSIHASMIKQGNTSAPLCTDCHGAHTVETMAVYQAETGYPCKKCHQNIFHAYTESVHGDARLNGNVIRDTHIQAPICSDCHRSHDINALAIGDTLRSTCIGCHENVVLLHNQWLPNAGTHLDIVSCAVCHAPFAKRKFDLHLFDNVTQLPVSQQEGDESIQQQLQAMEEVGGSVVDMLKTWRTKRGENKQGQTPDISIRGRMEVQSGIAAHQIASKGFAVRTCDSCHDDSRQSQKVTFSITQADGRKQSIEADEAMLNSVSAVNSISDFYALGGNPNKLLDIMLLLSLAAGIAIPIGHFTMGKMIKEKIERGEQ